ncbi:diguanylate cyclase [Acetobacter sp.]
MKYTVYYNGHSTIWPADALMLAAIFSKQIKNINAVTLITFLANTVSHYACGYHGLSVLCYAGISSLQIFLSNKAYIRFVGNGILFSEYKYIIKFNLYSGLVFPFVCALLGAASNAAFSGTLSLNDLSGWFFALSLGNITFTRPFTYILDGTLVKNIRNFAKNGLKKSFLAFMSISITLYAAYYVFHQIKYPFLFITTSLVISNSLISEEVFGSIVVMMIAVMATRATFDLTGPIALMQAGYLGRQAVLQTYLIFTVFTERAVSVLFMRNKTLAQSVAEREQMLALVMVNSTDCMISIDRDGVCLWAGGASVPLLGYDAQNIQGKHLMDILTISDKDRGLIKEYFANERQQHVFFAAVPVSNQSLSLSLSLRKSVTNGIVSGAIVTVNDISEETHKIAIAVEKSEKDPLTHLLNRAGFNEKMKSITAGKEDLYCISYIDIDHFKNINDTYGHDAGDTILTDVSELMQNFIHPHDILSRFGGDEFVIVHLITESDAKAFFGTLVAEIENTTFTLSNNVEIKITISCGFTRYQSGKTVDSIIQEADTALYTAKKSGRNRICEFSADLVN